MRLRKIVEVRAERAVFAWFLLAVIVWTGLGEGALLFAREEGVTWRIDTATTHEDTGRDNTLWQNDLAAKSAKDAKRVPGVAALSGSDGALSGSDGALGADELAVSGDDERCQRR